MAALPRLPGVNPARSTRRVHPPVQCVCPQQDDVPLQRGVEHPARPLPHGTLAHLDSHLELVPRVLVGFSAWPLELDLVPEHGVPWWHSDPQKRARTPAARRPCPAPWAPRGSQTPGEEGGAQGGGTEGNEGLALWQEHPMCHTIAAPPRLRSQSPRAAAHRPVPFSAPLQVPPHSPHCLTAARGDSACQDRQLWHGTQSRAGHCTRVGAGQDCAHRTATDPQNQGWRRLDWTPEVGTVRPPPAQTGHSRSPRAVSQMDFSDLQVQRCHRSCAACSSAQSPPPKKRVLHPARAGPTATQTPRLVQHSADPPQSPVLTPCTALCSRAAASARPHP